MLTIIADRTGSGSWEHVDFATNNLHARIRVKELISTNEYREVIAIPHSAATVKKKRSYSHLTNGARPAQAPAPVAEVKVEAAVEEEPVAKKAPKKKSAKKKATSGLV